MNKQKNRVVVDYLSGWFEVNRLPCQSVANIVYCLRQHYSRYGLPLQVRNVNSPFASAEFRRFAERLKFQHITSSPRYSQSNGRAESVVKTAKSLMIEAQEMNTDLFLALLEWRNTHHNRLVARPQS